MINRYTVFMEEQIAQLSATLLPQHPRMLELQAQIRDLDRQIAGEAQKILAHDVPAVYLFELPKIGVWDAKLEGMWANSPIQANDLTQVKWAD